MPRFQYLTCMWLNHNYMKSKLTLGHQKLTHFLYNSVNRNGLTSIGVIALAGALQHNKSLEELK